jgi:hypothetical protein
MAREINYPVGTKNVLKQARKDNVNYLLHYIKKAISLETPSAVFVGIIGSWPDAQAHLDANPHRDPVKVYTRNR